MDGGGSLGLAEGASPAETVAVTPSWLALADLSVGLTTLSASAVADALGEVPEDRMIS